MYGQPLPHRCANPRHAQFGGLSEADATKLRSLLEGPDRLVHAKGEGGCQRRRPNLPWLCQTMSLRAPGGHPANLRDCPAASHTASVAAAGKYKDGPVRDAAPPAVLLLHGHPRRRVEPRGDNIVRAD